MLDLLHSFSANLSPGFALLALVATLITTWCIRQRDWNRRSQGYPLPPGPKPWPLVGNLFDIPSGTLPWRVYSEWSSIYGNIILLRGLQSPMIVVSSSELATDLMEKRSAIYSDKPASTLDEMIGWGWNLGLMPYGERWRSIRRVVHQHFHRSASAKFRPHHLREVRRFLSRASKFEDALNPLAIRQIIATVIMDVVFGIEVKSMDDTYIHTAQEAVHYLSESKRPGAFWVDFMPALRYIPAWIPGASAAKLAVRCRPVVDRLRNMAFDVVRNGQRGQDCMALGLIKKIECEPDIGRRAVQEEHVKDACAILYAAAVDTIFGILTSFFCAMVMHPELQAKARDGLDDVVGPNRLPEYSDHDSLPLIQAIVLESIRWIPVLPLGVPHCNTQDDYYGGYFIPKGTQIVPNIWAMLHDPRRYPDPEDFKPERFIKDGKVDLDAANSVMVAFGFGRRICPGRYYALDHAFLVIASVLHVFDIVSAVDQDGNPVDPRPQPTTGLFSYTDRLPCMLKTRSSAAAELINANA